MNPGGDWLQHADMANQLTEEEKKNMPAAALMISSLMSNYMQLLKEPKTAGQKIGVGEHIDAVSYTVGFIPVLRFTLADASAFNKFIEDTEKRENIVPIKSVAARSGHLRTVDRRP